MLDIFSEKIKKNNDLTFNNHDFVIKSKLYLDELKSNGEFCLRLEKIGDLENFAYFNLKHNKNSEAIKIILNYKNYIKLSFNHYLNFFCVATPVPPSSKLEVPFIEKDRFGNEYRLYTIHILFLLLGTAFFFISLYLYIKVFLSLFFHQLKCKKYEIF